MIAVAAMTQVAGYDRNTMAAREFPEPGQEMQHADPSQPVPVPAYPRVGFTGIRAVVSRLTHNVMPSTPTTPAKIVADRGGDLRPGQPATMPIRAAAVYVPVQSANQTTPWWQVNAGNDVELF